MALDESSLLRQGEKAYERFLDGDPYETPLNSKEDFREAMRPIPVISLSQLISVTDMI
jgi:hypothetical protein